MEDEKKRKFLHVLDQIALDAERDVSEADGQPFTGPNIAVFNGKQNAMIKALATILKEIII